MREKEKKETMLLHRARIIDTAMQARTNQRLDFSSITKSKSFTAYNVSSW